MVGGHVSSRLGQLSFLRLGFNWSTPNRLYIAQNRILGQVYNLIKKNGSGPLNMFFFSNDHKRWVMPLTLQPVNFPSLSTLFNEYTGFAQSVIGVFPCMHFFYSYSLHSWEIPNLSHNSLWFPEAFPSLCSHKVLAPAVLNQSSQ